jgi:hypothetical protein
MEGPSRDTGTCVHLVTSAQERYSLVYYGEKCPHKGFTPLPEQEYDRVMSWAFNASHYGILSPVERFMIMSRLATRERRWHTHVLAALPGRAPFIQHKWTQLADQAYLGLSSGPARTDHKTTVERLEKSLLKKNFVKPNGFFRYRFISRRLSGAAREDLADTFREAEAALAKDPRMTAPARTMEEAVNEAPVKYRLGRRMNFGIFRIEK